MNLRGNKVTIFFTRNAHFIIYFGIIVYLLQLTMPHLKKALIAGCAATLFAACTFTTSLDNRESDRDEAEKITNKFYEDLKANNYDVLDTLFSQEFFQASPKDSLLKFLNSMHKALGDITADSVIDWKTKITRGTVDSSDYRFLYAVKRTKHNSKETLRLVKVPSGKIKIVYYHVDY